MEKGFSGKEILMTMYVEEMADTAAEAGGDEGLPKMNVKRHEESINLKVIPVLCVS